MRRIYRTDGGHEMNEDDFLAYLNWKIELLIEGGLSEVQIIRIVLERDYWGDSIMDEDGFEEIKRILLVRLKVYYND